MMAHARKKVKQLLIVVGLTVPVWNQPALAGDGPAYTPLSPFTDGQVAKHVWTVPGVIKKNNYSTDFMCTSLEVPGTAIDIGVEVFDKDGTQLNNVGVDPSPGTCSNGAVLGIPAGSTVTIGLTGTQQVHEDCVIGTGIVANGSARIVSNSSRISCNAIVLDSKHVVADPATCPTCPPPPATSLKVIKSKKQSGD